MGLSSSATAPTDAEIVQHVRERAGLAELDGGPSDELIVQGVRGFAREFRYWYNRVLEEAVPKYQKLIIDRINPMIRGMQLEGLPASQVAERLLADWAHRNYVTAGGWALEQLAIAASPRLRKSSATGIDAEWHESGPPPVVHLYVIKSGTVTRNSDILKALKTHGQEAQKRLMQTDKKAIVRVYYVVTAGQRSSNFHDGVHRPSSAEFWAQTFALEDDENKAIDLALAMAQEAGVLLRQFADDTALRAMETAVAAYIAVEDDSTVVDWEFLAQRNMIDDAAVKAEGALRHKRAQQAVKDAGYTWPATGRKRKADAVQAEALAEAAAALTPEMESELGEMLPDPVDGS
jgi:hypothetical protein